MAFNGARLNPTEQPWDTTNYTHPHDPNLSELHRTMDYNALGEPILRVGLNPAAADAFGRLRVSNPYTLFDSFHRYQDNGKVSEQLTGGATSAHDPNSSSIVLTVPTTAGASAIRETSRVFPYQPGKGLQMLITFVMAAPKENLRQRVGLFDTANGIFLEQDGSTTYLVIRSSSSGVLEERRVAQQDWNIDPFDGTGQSTVALDLTKAQIFFADIEWLGVGSVRCGFVVNGEFVPVHTFHWANTLPATTTYMGTAVLPGRAEIVNTGITDSSSVYRQICFSIISEGGYELRGRPRSIGHDLAAARSISSANGYVPLLTIRLKADRLGAVVLPKNFSINVTAAAKFQYQIISSAVTAGGTWVSAGTNSAVEYNLTATGITNGTVLETGYIISSNQASVSPSLSDFPFAYQLERNTFIPTAYEFVIAMKTDGQNQSVYASVNWEEIT
jgi:hypothetical protein